MRPADASPGWIAVPRVLTAAEASIIATACAGLAARLERDGLGSAEIAAGDKVVGGTQHLNHLEDRLPEVSGLLTNAGLVTAVVDLFGGTDRGHLDRGAPERIAVLDGPGIAYRNPRPSYGAQKLHADAIPQPGADSPTTAVTAIIALVDFTSTNGATRVVPGSHRRPDLQRDAGRLDAHPDEIVLTGPAGTAFVFSGHLLHSGTVNRSAADRPALQMAWRLAADARR